MLQCQRGFILVTALLLLTIITLLVLTIFTNSHLEIKMAAHYQNKMFAFQTAENQLVAAEHYILQQQQDKSANYNYSKWRGNPCPLQAQCFLITAVGHYQQAVCTLHALFVLEFQQQNNQLVLLKGFQQSWWMNQ